MKHLTVDEIIRFVSSDRLNDETLNLSLSVNEHIRKCERCRKLVKAFLMIYDEFSSMDIDKDFVNFIFDADFKETCEDESVIELETALEEYDGFR